MRNWINSHIIANEIRMMSIDYSDVFIISETSHYARVMRHFLNKKRNNILVAHKKQNVIDALIELRKDGYDHIYGCLEESIDTGEYADILPKILFASNWSNKEAKQQLGLEYVDFQSFNAEQETNPGAGTLSQSEIFTSIHVENYPSDTPQQSPEAVISALKEALQMGHSEEAIKLVRLGVELFPDNPYLSRMAKILAPPVISVSEKSYTSSLTVARQWLRENAQNYKGRWVAVHGETLVGNALSMKDLLVQIGPNVDRDSTLITKVL